MRHKIAGRKFGKRPAHRMLMFRNLVTDLLKYEKVVTTEAKAKEIRGFAEQMITLGKDGSLVSRRQALEFVLDKAVVDKVFTEIAPKYKERQGGYTRLTKLAPRLGDGAAQAKLELV